MSGAKETRRTDAASENTSDAGCTVCLRNPHIQNLNGDILYHLGLGTKTHDLVKMFGDVKFVCMGGTPHRMETFAKYCESELGDVLPAGSTVHQVLEHSHRYSMYKVGPILAVSHGMGVSSMQILLHEVIKLSYYARMRDPIYFRIGTSGGIGIEPGSVVVSLGAVDELINPYHEQVVCGEKVRRPAELDQELAKELSSLHKPGEDEYKVVNGRTMCAMDFYEGQGRLDGAFCYHTEEKKMAYLRRLHAAGVVNIEMEATGFAAFTHLANIRAAIVCVTFLNRLHGDQVSTPKETLLEWEKRPQEIVARYIRRQLSKNK
ncbi:uridine phosphorylase 1-like [Copidosoma floridanum]|uniref:uridine phosphorylase 1-like n=1 Tax=Copidosoma floridanum TaxID=29053 RepID=UPI0006C9C19C|nr:uridine phosphorylase 1-like [Copidosoma floridanum]